MTYIESGKTLPTKDGRRIGNAVVRSVESIQNKIVCHCVTDYGNEFVFTEEELKELFYLEYQSPWTPSLKRWIAERKKIKE
jgi:hypothetical protein